jgi:hypothetical protein
MTPRAEPYPRMADYTIIFDGLSDFGVEVLADGIFRSVRGFLTEVAAQAWIDEQRRGEAPADTKKEC